MMYNEKKSTDIRIRRLENRDTESVLQAISAAAEIYCKASGIASSQIDAGKENAQTIQDMFASSFFYGAELNNRIIGTIRLTFPRADGLISSEIRKKIVCSENDLCCYISRFYVNPEFHGTGTGSRLIAFAENEARKVEAVGLFLHSAVSNKDMLSFYQKRGLCVIISENSKGYDRGTFYKSLNDAALQREGETYV